MEGRWPPGMCVLGSSVQTLPGRQLWSVLGRVVESLEGTCLPGDLTSDCSPKAEGRQSRLSGFRVGCMRGAGHMHRQGGAHGLGWDGTPQDT